MRIKRGQVKKAKHNRVLKLAKGYRLTKSKLYRRAKEQLLHSGEYSYAHRKKRQGDFRTIWISRISAALTDHDISYSRFIKALKDNNVELNRKVLSEMAIHNPEAFNQVVAQVSK